MARAFFMHAACARLGADGGSWVAHGHCREAMFLGAPGSGVAADPFAADTDSAAEPHPTRSMVGAVLLLTDHALAILTDGGLLVAAVVPLTGWVNPHLLLR